MATGGKTETTTTTILIRFRDDVSKLLYALSKNRIQKMPFLVTHFHFEELGRR